MLILKLIKSKHIPVVNYSKKEFSLIEGKLRKSFEEGLPNKILKQIIFIYKLIYVWYDWFIHSNWCFKCTFMRKEHARCVRSSDSYRIEHEPLFFHSAARSSARQTLTAKSISNGGKYVRGFWNLQKINSTAKCTGKMEFDDAIWVEDAHLRESTQMVSASG